MEHLSKPKRIVCKKTLAKFRGVTCEACGKYESSNPAHIKSVGSGGDDVENNLIALCFKCHRYQHDYGWDELIAEHSHIEIILEIKGWKTNSFGKLEKIC